MAPGGGKRGRDERDAQLRWGFRAARWSTLPLQWLCFPFPFLSPSRRPSRPYVCWCFRLQTWSIYWKGIHRWYLMSSCGIFLFHLKLCISPPFLFTLCLQPSRPVFVDVLGFNYGLSNTNAFMSDNWCWFVLHSFIFGYISSFPFLFLLNVLDFKHDLSTIKGIHGSYLMLVFGVFLHL